MNILSSLISWKCTQTQNAGFIFIAKKTKNIWNFNVIEMVAKTTEPTDICNPTILTSDRENV